MCLTVGSRRVGSNYAAESRRAGSLGRLACVRPRVAHVWPRFVSATIAASCCNPRRSRVPLSTTRRGLAHDVRVDRVLGSPAGRATPRRRRAPRSGRRRAPLRGRARGERASAGDRAGSTPVDVATDSVIAFLATLAPTGTWTPKDLVRIAARQDLLSAPCFRASATPRRSETMRTADGTSRVRRALVRCMVLPATVFGAVALFVANHAWGALGSSLRSLRSSPTQV